MAKQFDKTLGIIFILIGLLGFIPALTPHNMLFGLFMVNGIHNIIHLFSGAILLWAGLNVDEHSARNFAMVFGIIYALITLLGFMGHGAILGFIPVNTGDNILHLLIAVSALAVGASRERAIPFPR